MSWTLYLPKDIDIYEEVNRPNKTGEEGTLNFTTDENGDIEIMCYSFRGFDELGSVYKKNIQ